LILSLTTNYSDQSVYVKTIDPLKHYRRKILFWSGGLFNRHHKY